MINVKIVKLTHGFKHMVEIKDQEFEVGDSVVYPEHGVGEIVAIEENTYSGVSMELYVIIFTSKDYNLNSLTLRIPKKQAEKSGMRSLASKIDLKKAIDFLSDGIKAKVNKMIWNKRLKEYEDKINSGAIMLIVEVLKQLAPLSKSYSEKAIFDDALNRFAREYSAVYNLSLGQATEKISNLIKSNY